jgi:hypothetical protein
MPLPQALYLALTGARLTEPSDLIAAGLATHYVPSERLEALRNSLLSQVFGPENASAQLAACVAAHAAEPPELLDSQGITASKDLINEAMQPALDAMECGKGSAVAVKEILEKLDAMVRAIKSKRAAVKVCMCVPEVRNALCMDNITRDIECTFL